MSEEFFDPFEEEKPKPPEVSIERAERARDYVAGMEHEATLTGLASLSLFNTLKGADSAEIENVDLSNWRTEFERVNQEESWAKNPRNILPAMGLELEVPEQTVSPEESNALKLLGIDNSPETNYRKWHEIRTGYSYSGMAQAYTLHEIYEFKDKAHLGIVREIIKKDTDTGSEPANKGGGVYYPDSDSFATSLHVNFGVPDWVNKKDDLEENSGLKLLSAIVGCAFTSPDRIRERKTRGAVRQKEDALESTKNTSDSPASGENRFVRFELRIPEFKDASIYRMLIEVQYIVSAFMCGVAQEEKKDPLKENLSKTWDLFVHEATELLSASGLQAAHFENVPPGAAHVLENNDHLRKNARSLFTHYAQEIKKQIEIAFPRN